MQKILKRYLLNCLVGHIHPIDIQNHSIVVLMRSYSTPPPPHPTHLKRKATPYNMYNSSMNIPSSVIVTLCLNQHLRLGKWIINKELQIKNNSSLLQVFSNRTIFCTALTLSQFVTA